jgi:hypothetical protein
MPWHLEEIPGSNPKRFFVVTDSTKRKHSKEGLTLAMAKKQLAALHINVKDERKK